MNISKKLRMIKITCTSLFTVFHNSLHEICGESLRPDLRWQSYLAEKQYSRYTLPVLSCLFVRPHRLLHVDVAIQVY